MTLLLALFLQTAGAGALEGLVTSVDTDAPVVGAEVVVDSLDVRATTDGGGGFRIDGIPEGRWLVRVTADGFLAHTVVVRSANGRTTRVDFALRPIADPELTRQRRRGRIHGIVREDGRSTPIRYASVRVVGTSLAAVTDEGGFFSLGGVPPGRRTLRVEAPGYATADSSVVMTAGGTRWFGVRLPPAPVAVEGVVVPSTRVGRATEAPEAFVMDTLLLDLVPTAVERDVLRGVQALPSVTPSSDYSSALFVRGGTPDQTRILLDGAPVHNPYHIGGFVSAFAPSATARAVLRPGALPASAASGLSGVLEVETRDGGRDSLRAAGSVGLLSSHLTLDGPLGERAGFLVSGRRTYVDVATGVADRLGLADNPIPYGFWDAHGKLSVDVGRAGSLSLSGYLNREAIEAGSRNEGGGWGSSVASARYAGVLGSRLRITAGASRSDFGVRFDRGDAPSPEGPGLAQLADVDAGVRTWSTDAEVRSSLGPHELFLGMRWEDNQVDHRLAPEGSEVDLVPPMLVSGSFGGLALYARDRVAIGERASLDLGVRAVRPTQRRWHVLPRGRIAFDTGALTVGLGAGRYVQDGWSLRNEESVPSSVVGYDLTAPVPRDEPIRSGWDAVLDVGWYTSSASIRANAFAKRLRHVPTSPPLANPVEGTLLHHVDSVRLGSLDVEGVEVHLVGSVAGTTLAAAYRFQREERRLGSLTFAPRHSRSHRVVLTGSRPLGEREAAFALTWMSGLAASPVVGTLPDGGGVDAEGRLVRARARFEAAVLGDPNTERLASYLRLDLDLRGAWDWTLFGRSGVLEPYVSVLNVLNGRNVLWADPHALSGEPAISFGPQLPILPSFGVRWRF